MRKAFTLAAGLVLLAAALAAAAGYWLAPRMVRNALSERAERAGFVFQAEHVRTDPLRLTVELEQASVTGEAGEGTARSVTAAISWSSLWKRGWIVEHVAIRDARLHAVAKRADRPFEQSVVVRQLEVENADIDLPGFKLLGASFSASQISTRPGDPAPYRLSGRFPAGGTLVSEGQVLSLAPLRATGEFSYADVPLQSMWRTNKLIAGTASGRAVHTYDGRLSARDASLESANASYAGIELSRLSLRSAVLSIPPREPYEITGEAGVEPNGSIQAAGTIDPGSRSADLQVKAESLALAKARRLVPAAPDVSIAGGALSGSGRLQLSADKGMSYRGAASIADLRVLEAGSNGTLLAWRRAQAAHVEFAPGVLQISQLSLEQPEGRLIIDQNGRLNALAAFGGRDTAGKPPLRVAIQDLRISAGKLYFADRSLASPFETLIHDLSGSISGIQSGGDKPAKVQLAGLVQPSGSVRIEGHIDLASPSSATDVRGTFRNLRLVSFNPYVVKFAGYRIESGNVSANLRYQVRSGRLEGTNELALEQMQLGEKVGKARALDFPLDLLVALLADSSGRIDLHIPVSGDLRDPKFDFGAVFAQAMRKIVTAPFRALRAVLGKAAPDREFGEVAFEPGMVDLSRQARQDLEHIAQALAQRPQVVLSVCGGYDPQRDAAALRLLGARREIAARAGAKAPSGPEEREMIVAAERLYLERIGSRLELQALREQEKHYGSALAEILAKQVPVTEDATRLLGRRRAETVVTTLSGLGGARSRLRIDAAERGQAGQFGVPAKLTLSARGSR